MSALASHDGRALGTVLRLVVAGSTALDTARQAVDAVLAEVDRSCSRFRQDSELNRLMLRAGQETTVSPMLMAALGAALRGAELSDGAVDPTIGAALRAAGYAVDFAGVARDGPAVAGIAHPAPGWRSVELDAARHSVRIPAGVELDLGSTAKALAADLAAAAALAAIGHGGVLVSLGGDVAVVGEPPPGDWSIQLAENSEATADPEAETVVISGGGLCTSSTTVRTWRRGGELLHHIIDPATGRPARGPWRTVTVAAGDCLDANIAATGSIVRGDTALDWLTERGLPARLVALDGAIARTAGWPQARTAP